MRVESVCGVIFTTERLDEMVGFYRDVLGLALEPEEHGGLDRHYGVNMGSLHFAIHPLSSFDETKAGNASAKVAFQVDSLSEYVARLEAHGYKPVREPHDEGFGPVASFRDPDGNLIELVELSFDF
ncbi:MAG: VOC family protein [Blastocatellia bacterium]|nr:VOC family protein [Blastocatellia bacterium]